MGHALPGCGHVSGNVVSGDHLDRPFFHDPVLRYAPRTLDGAARAPERLRDELWSCDLGEERNRTRRLSPAPARALPTAALLMLALALGACASHAGGGASEGCAPGRVRGGRHGRREPPEHHGGEHHGGERHDDEAGAPPAPPRRPAQADRRSGHGAAPPLAAPRGAAALRVPILMYRRIADPAAARSDLERSLTVSPAAFATQMR